MSMKILWLVRHGKAVSRFEEIPDYERPLIDRGRETTAMVAVRLSDRGIAPHLIVSSPAPRAEETARIIAKGLGYRTGKIAHRKSMYDQKPGALMDVVRSLDDSVSKVILVGHNPSMTDFTLELTGDTKVELPTSGAVEIELAVAAWSEVVPGCGTFVWFENPKNPPRTPRLKELRKELTQILIERIETAVEELHLSPSKKAAKKTAKAGKKLAKKLVKDVKPSLA
jgi:phosphohistidine phosphatase